jgi:hypothetical protein
LAGTGDCLVGSFPQKRGYGSDLFVGPTGVLFLQLFEMELIKAAVLLPHLSSVVLLLNRLCLPPEQLLGKLSLLWLQSSLPSLILFQGGSPDIGFLIPGVSLLGGSVWLLEADAAVLVISLFDLFPACPEKLFGSCPLGGCFVGWGSSFWLYSFLQDELPIFPRFHLILIKAGKQRYIYLRHNRVLLAIAEIID